MLKIGSYPHNLLFFIRNEIATKTHSSEWVFSFGKTRERSLLAMDWVYFNI